MFKLFMLFALVSCATGYKPHGFSGGYSEQKVAQDMYRVSFSGNGYTGGEDVQRNLLRRCAHLTLLEGHSHFVIVGSGGDTDTSYMANTYGNQTNIYAVNKRTQTATIKMISNPLSYSVAFDAKLIFGEIPEELKRDIASGSLQKWE